MAGAKFEISQVWSVDMLTALTLTDPFCPMTGGEEGASESLPPPHAAMAAGRTITVRAFSSWFISMSKVVLTIQNLTFFVECKFEC